MSEPIICAVADCGRPRVAKGMCWAHYQRSRRNRPMAGPVRKHAGSDPETQALAVCLDRLNALDPGARARVLTYLTDRWPDPGHVQGATKP